ncbi:MAG: SUMF1/EgtB/PvdO family nonheme iron enzyme [Acidobacteriota bacterium]
MLRKYGIFLLAITLVCIFSACGQQEQAEEMEATEPVPEETKPAIVPGEMVFVPAGEFILGTDNKESFAYYPSRTTTLPAFWIDKYEITNLEFLDFTNESGYMGEDIQGKNWRLFFTSFDKANDPAILTWNDAKAYCESKGKRLPSELEWEKAARGSEGFKYPWGNEWENGKSNTYESGLKAPAAIGAYKGDVSPYGAYDMLGNVQEWTASEYKPYKGNPKKDPNQIAGLKVARGLSYGYYGSKASLFERSAYLPSAIYNFGARCARDATPEEIASESNE